MKARRKNQTGAAARDENVPAAAVAHAPLLARARESLRRLDWPLVAMVLTVKVLLLVFAAQAYQVLSNQPLKSFYAWLEIWNRWDAPHYLDIARDGYVTTGVASRWLVFYPLYPWLVRAFGVLTGGDQLVAAFLVSALASVAAALLLHRLARLDFEETIARGAVWFLLIFPTSYFLHIGYTESLFVALAVGCFLAARRDRWLLAGVLGALAAFTRVNGSILLPCLAVEALQQWRATRRFEARWLWSALVACGLGAYLVLNKYVAGDFFAFQKIVGKYWQKELTPPWVGIGGVVDAVSGRAPSEAAMIGTQEFLFIALGLVATVWCWKNLRPSYGVWMTLNWLLWTSTSFVLSSPRYTVILFPVYFMFARLAAARPVWNAAITVWSLLFLALFAAQFVQGFWAF